MDSNHSLFDEGIFSTVSLADQDFPAPALYVVGLPIGNFADITLRGLWTLNLCDAVAAEDTRVTGKLLQKFNIAKETFSLHQHNEQSASEHLLKLLAEGKRVALVTDAGTPAISDPGAKAVRHARENGYPVIPIPGTSAAITALSAAGAAPEGFIFQGFLEDGLQKRRQTIELLCNSERTFVLYEAPHRMAKLAEELAEIVPRSRTVWVARELTKKFEEIKEFSSAAEIPVWFKKHAPKGEFVVIVNAESQKKDTEIDPMTEQWIQRLFGRIPTKELSEIVSDVTGVPKRKAYEQILLARGEQEK